MKQWLRERAALLIMILALATLFVIQQIQTDKSQSRQDRSELAQCLRVQIVRKHQNLLSYVVWLGYDKDDPAKRKRYQKKLNWTPLTNCHEAVQHANTYHPPHSILFSKQIPSLSVMGLSHGTGHRSNS